MTPQEEQFLLTISKFVKNSPDHALILSNSYLNLPLQDILDWSEGRNFPETAIQTRVISFTINHYCDCKCPAKI